MSDRGVVLISVLWVVLIISFIAFSLAAAVRTEVRAAESAFDSERAFFMAKSAAEVLFQNLQKPGILDQSPVQRENGAYVFPFDSGEVRVRLQSNTGLIDVNAASEELLAAMFDSLGLPLETRNELVDSVLDWRDIDDVPRLYGAEVDNYGQVFLGAGRLPRNALFQNVEELLLVRGITPGIYYGYLEFDAARNSYRKVSGLRELVTLGSDRNNVDVNQASLDVIAALPAMDRELAGTVLAERDQRPFGSVADLVARIPVLQDSPALQYISTEMGPSTAIVSTATIAQSGASRTVRLQFARERKKQFYSFAPPLYKEIEILQFGSWRY